jgi:hypothetical protein
MQFILVTILTGCVFAFCFAVFLLKGHREGGAPRLHRCSEGDDCHCYGGATHDHQTHVVQILDHLPSRGGEQNK